MNKFTITKLARLSMSALVIISAPSVFADWEKDREYSITILHTNDHHGNYWENSRGEGGLAARKALIDSIRKEVSDKGGSLLLLDAGDVNTGTPESDLLDAEPDFKGMDYIGYDAMTLGNHEFDNPLETLYKQQSWVKFPFLATNIYEKGKDNRLFTPYKIFERQGLDIAVFGLTTKDTARLGSKRILANVEFRSHTEETIKVLNEIKQVKKPDITIGLTHLGYYENAKYGSNAPGDVSLARSLPKGSIDVIVGGHSHTAVCMSSVNDLKTDYMPATGCYPEMQNGTWILQSLDAGKYLGRADLTFKNGEVTLKSYKLLPVNLKYSTKAEDGSKKYHTYATEIKPDQAATDLLTPFKKQSEAKLGEFVGKSEVKLEGDRKFVRFQQTNMAELIIRAQMARTNADFGIMSSGSVRDSMEAGDITYRDILLVQPFGNTVAYAELTGKEVVDYMQVVANKTSGSGGYAQFANIEFSRDGDTITNIKIAGKALELDKVYRISMPSYNASGGDGYPELHKHTSFVNTGFIDAEVLFAYIKDNSPIRE